MRLKTANNYSYVCGVLEHQAYLKPLQASEFANKLFKKAQREKGDVEYYLLDIVEKANSLDYEGDFRDEYK